MDRIDGVDCTLIDNGMPIVVMAARDLGLSGQESRDEIEAMADLRARIEGIRLQAGRLMNLGDVTTASVPKMTLVSPAMHGGAISTRSFIPHRVHASVGVFAAISVASACLTAGSPAQALAQVPPDGRFLIEHPSGALEVFLDIGAGGTLQGAGSIRTARKLFDGLVLNDRCRWQGVVWRVLCVFQKQQFLMIDCLLEDLESIPLYTIQ